MPTHFPARRLARSLFALLALGFLIGSLACGGDSVATAETSGGTPRDTTRVVVLGGRDLATVRLLPVTSGVAVAGSLDPAERVQVKSQITGQVDSVFVDRGSVVKRGDVLATIDARVTRAQVASAAAALASAERDLRASDTLFKAGAISERDFVQSKVGRDAALAQLTLHRETLARATVTSPITGVISTKSIEPGEIVQLATELFAVVNTSTLELRGGIPAASVGLVRVGQRVALTADAMPGVQMEGQVARIEPVAEEGTRQVRVYVRVNNASRSYVPGVFASGTILVGGASIEPLPTLPLRAVRTVGERSVVFAVIGDRLEERRVELGASDPDRGIVVVRSGISVGTRVLAQPDASLRDGMRVRVLADSASRALGAPPGGN